MANTITTRLIYIQFRIRSKFKCVIQYFSPLHIRTTSRQCHVIHTSLHTLKLLLHCSDGGREVVLSISISSSNRQYLCCKYSGETLLSLPQLLSVLEKNDNIISTLYTTRSAECVHFIIVIVLYHNVMLH